LLSLLTCWGVVVTFLPKRPRWLVGTRFLVLAAGGAGVALMLWGYIAPRYIADFMPLLILGGGLGLVELWRRLDGRGRGLRRGFVAGVLVLTVYSVVANFGIAVTPNEEWTQVQTLNFVKTAQTLSRLTGDPLRGRVQTGSTLPAYAPAGQLFIVGHCDGLYISNGEDYSHDPVQQFIRYTWMPVQRGPAQQQSWAVRFRRPPAGGTESVVLATLGGRDRVVVNASAARALGMVRVTFALYGERKTVRGVATQVPAGTTHDVVVVADPAKHTVSASLDGQAFMAGYIVLPQPTRFAGAVSSSAPPGSLPALEARNTTPPGMPSLCSQLLPPGRVA
ncbi:MAG TPA: hypothetical protein VKW77_05165, partial [Acidimicrobiales bacterium]|nr:hypothetical protein [Acidimicrobiales bacterium]